MTTPIIPIVHLRKDDPRQGWTSASNAGPDKLCPGRHQAQKGIPDTDSEWSEHGDKIHAALADSGDRLKMEALSTDQREMFDSHREVEKGLITRIWPGENGGTPTQVLREQRYWCRVPVYEIVQGAGVGVASSYLHHSGQADMVMIRGNKALIQDYKSLVGDVEESPRNEQLRDLAVMVWRSHGLDEVYVAINQPWISRSPEPCLYTKEDLARAEQEMWERVRKSNDPNAPRVAGAIQCKWCKAKSICKEYTAWAASLLPEKPSPFTVFMSDWTPEQRATVADHIPRLRKLLDDSEDYLKGLLKADPEAVPGFHLKDGKFREHITDPQELFNRFLALDGNLEQFMQCVKITKGGLEDQVRAVTKLKGKELKSQLDTLLAGITEKKQDQPSLAKRKDKK